MMNVFLRDKGRFPFHDRSAKRRRRSSRKYRSEQLESRAMLAGDVLNAYHNAELPTDVSGDGYVTLNDALILVSELRRSGPRALTPPLARGGEGEGGGNFYYDVNADQMLTLGDAIGVISDLRSEGEGLAMNDQFTVNESSSNNQLNVLNNDQSDPGDNLTINQIAVGIDGMLFTESAPNTVLTTVSGGELRIAGDRLSVFYTPLPGFFGEESFTYDLNDGNGGITTATVNITVDPINPAVRYRLETASAADPSMPITSIDQGESFVLNVYVQDIRTDLAGTGTNLGIEQGYLDVLYDMGLVTLNDTSLGELTFGSNFTQFLNAEFAPGEIGEVGAARPFSAEPPLDPLGGGEFLLFRARFTAETPGLAVFDANHPEEFFAETLASEPPGGEYIFSPDFTPPEHFFVLDFVGTELMINLGGFATSDSATVLEDSANNVIDVLANDITLPGGELGIVSVSNPPNGTAVIDDNGTPGDPTDDVILYTPDANFNGVDTFTYTASDGLGGTDSATVTVTVTDVNDPPTAVNDAFNVAFDSGPQTLNVLANDSTAPDSPMAETLTITNVGTPSGGGTATISGGGTTITYTPPAGAFTTSTFSYTISDGRGGTAMATVTITGVPFDEVVAFRLEPSATQVNEGDTFTVDVYIQDLRDDPTIDLGVASAFINLMYNSSIVSPVVDNSGNIVDFSASPYEQLNPPTIVSGALQNVGGFHPDAFTPGGIQNGGEEFLFFSVDFIAVGSGTAVFTTSESTNQTTFPIELQDTTGASEFVDPDDVDFGSTEVVVNPPVFDTDVVVSIQALDSMGVPVTFLQLGETFEIQVSIQDTRPTSPTPAVGPGIGEAYMDLLIEELGDVVTLVPGSFQVGPRYDFFELPGTPIPGVGIDDVGSSLSLSVIDDPTFDGNARHLVFSYQFQAASLGEATFQTASSGNSFNTIAYLDPSEPVPLNEITFGSTSVFVADPNAPMAISDRYTTFQNSAITIPAAAGVLNNDSDPNGDALTATLVAGPTNGTLTFNANGSFTYTPNEDFLGTDTFSYRAVDSTGLQSNTALVRIDVVPISPLAANDDVYTTPLGTTLTVNSAGGVLANDVGMGLSAELVSGVSHGTLTFNANGSFVYVPNAGFTGIDTFTYRATDSSGNVQVGRAAIGVGLTAGSLGGRVYIDSNLNGIYEPQLGELAIGGAEVTISGSAAGLGEFYQRTVTTNAAGMYGIGTLLPANYNVVEPFPEFLLSGTVTVNGTVTTNTSANLTSFTAFETLSGGESAVVNFGHMGIHPQFLTFRDTMARSPKTGLIIANDVDGNNLWYAMMQGWEGGSNPAIAVSADRLSADLSFQYSSGFHTATLGATGNPLFRYMGVREGVGSLIRVEGSMDEVLSAGEGELDPLALDALMAEGFDD